MYIRTGDIIMIEQDTQVTADVILLSTSDNNNLAFIETAELDGETNLKVRTALQGNKGDRIVSFIVFVIIWTLA